MLETLHIVCGLHNFLIGVWNINFKQFFFSWTHFMFSTSVFWANFLPVTRIPFPASTSYACGYRHLPCSLSLAPAIPDVLWVCLCLKEPLWLLFSKFSPFLTPDPWALPVRCFFPTWCATLRVCFCTLLLHWPLLTRAFQSRGGLPILPFVYKKDCRNEQ